MLSIATASVGQKWSYLGRHYFGHNFNFNFFSFEKSAVQYIDHKICISKN